MNALTILHGAIVELTKSDPGKSRLATCVSKYLSTIQMEDLPIPAQAQLAALLKSLTTVTPLRGETAIQATIRKMSNAEADSCASRIVDLYVTWMRLSVSTADPDTVASSATAEAHNPRQATLRYGRSH